MSTTQPNPQTLPAQLQAEIRKLVDSWSPFQPTRSSLREVATTNNA